MISTPQTIFDRLTASTPHNDCILSPGRTPLSYEVLRAHIHTTLSALAAAGIARNDRVGLVLPNGAEMAVALLAVMSGAAAAPLNPYYRTPEYEFYLSDLGAKALIVQHDQPSDARAVAQRLGIPVIELTPTPAQSGLFTLSIPDLMKAPIFAAPNDSALVLHTSGTTGRPKLVALTHANLLASVDHIVAALDLTGADRCLNVMPLFHIHGIVAALLSSLAVGGGVICTSGYTPEEFFPALTDLRPTWYTAVPTIHQAILAQIERQPDLASGHRLRFARSSSAALPPTVLRALETALAVPVIEAYGMTEAAHQIASNPLPPGTRKIGSVGVGVGVEIAVIDADGHFCAVGTRGEIVIKGENVIAGYHDNPRANADSFHAGWFRTGDEGLIDADGALFITGRLKEMINRGGEKIAPLEVDAALLEHPAVREALTFAVPHDTVGEAVGALVVLRDGATASDDTLRAFVAARLAYFKVPGVIVFGDALPKGATGKPQRVGAAEKLGLTLIESAAQAGTAPPQDALEMQIADIWRQVLGVERVGRHDRFLDRGGDSLRALRVIAQLRRTLAMPLTLTHFFDAPTVADMAVQIRQMRTSTSDADVSLGSAHSVDGHYPLSFTQEAIWLGCQIDPLVYQDARALRIDGALDPAALQHALDALLHENPTLRTRFADDDGVPFQWIGTDAALPLHRRSLTWDAVDAAVRDLLAQPFDLAGDLLLRAVLLECAPDSAVLVLITHNLICDGVTIALLYERLGVLYEALRADALSAIAPAAPTLGYSDYAVWQRATYPEALLSAQADAWTAALAGFPNRLALPLLVSAAIEARSADHAAHHAAHYANETLLIRQLDAETSARVRRLAADHAVTPFSVLLAVYAVLLFRYTEQSQTIVGTTAANRTHPDTTAMIGFFTELLPLPITVTAESRFSALIRHAHETIIAALDRQPVPLAQIVERLQIEREVNTHPLIQATITYKEEAAQPFSLGGAVAAPIYFGKAHTRMDLELEIVRDGDGMTCLFRWQGARFDAAHIARLAGHFATLLSDALAHPQQTASLLQMLTEGEIRQIVFDANDTARDLAPIEPLHISFERQVALTPDRIALIFDDAHCTYAQLDAAANRLAHHLRTLDVGAEPYVALCMGRSIDLIVAMLAVLKSGAAFVPIDPTFPPERIAWILDDCATALVITTADALDRLPDARQASALVMEALRSQLQAVPITTPAPTATPDDLMCVFYTSGSTGRPKGVLLEHRAMHNHFYGRPVQYRFSVDDTLLAAAAVSFDVFWYEVFNALLFGARLVILPPGLEADVPYRLDLVQRQSVTMVIATPSLLSLLLQEAQPDQLRSVRFFSVGGEALTPNMRARFHEALPDIPLMNAYGPSEASIVVSYERADLPARWTTIGAPIANTQLHVLDARLQPVPIGVIGGLYIGGHSLARGYLNLPELTVERFIVHPTLGRLYHTGDVARRLEGDSGVPDTFEFLGRSDFQVKLRGFRIELTEIEQVLLSHPGVEAAIVVIDGRDDEPRLVAYTVGDASIPVLRAFLESRLPHYMIPAAFVQLDAMPLTAHEKVDRRALPQPDYSADSEPFIAPRTDTEHQLATMFQELLGVQDIGANSHFFHLGGHSLLGTRLLMRIRRAFGVTLYLRILFQTPTVAALAQKIDSAASTIQDDREHIRL